MAAGGDATLAAATLHEPRSRRVLTLRTPQPALQLYTANRLDVVGKGVVRHRPWSAVCLETQGFPDAVHHPGFPSPRLEAGALYQHSTEYALSVA